MPTYTKTRSFVSSSGSVARSGSDISSWTGNTADLKDANNTTGTAIDIDKSSYSKYQTAYNWGFSIPATDTIVGIAVSITVESEGANGRSDAFGFYQGGSFDEGASPTQGDSPTKMWGSSAGVHNYGGATDLWGETYWSPSVINSSNFGFGISAYNTNTGVSRLMYCREFTSITVYTIAAASKFWCPPMGWVLGAFGISQMIDPIMRKTKVGVKRYIQRDGGLILCPSF